MAFWRNRKGHKKCFLVSVEDRGADTLIPIIKKNLLPGTTMISDCEKVYSKLKEEGYQHHTVNHNKRFTNKETGAHTNTIESTWRAVKTSLPKHGTVKSLYDTYFVEYIFIKRHRNSATYQFLAFFDLLKNVFSLIDSQRLNPIPKPLEKKRSHSNIEINPASKRPALQPLTNILNMSSDDDFQ